MTVHDVIFPQNIIKKVQSSKFYVVLSRGNKDSATQACTIDENGQTIFEDACELEATLIKNRKTNEFLTKHCRMILKQIKPTPNDKSSNKEKKKDKKNESTDDMGPSLTKTVGSIKRDLVTYATQKQAQQETVQFTKWLVLLYLSLLFLIMFLCVTIFQLFFLFFFFSYFFFLCNPFFLLIIILFVQRMTRFF